MYSRHRMYSRRRIVSVILPLAIVIAAVLVWMAMNGLRDQPVRHEASRPGPTVQVQTVKLAPLALTVRSQGTVTPRHRIEWASEVAGRVMWVAPEFVEGNSVVAGALLMRLDDTDYRVAVAEAEAALQDARLALAEERGEFQRCAVYRAGQPDAAGGGLRQPKLRQVESRVEAAEERLKQARQDLARTEVHAPFAGVIDSKQVDIGQYVSTGTILFNLLSTEIVEVRLPITAGDVGFIAGVADLSVNQPGVTLSTTGDLRQQWRARLVRIEQRVDPVTRTFYGVAQVHSPYDRQQHPMPLVIGMFVEAVIEGREVDGAVRLPRTAVHADQYVYLVEKGKLVRRDITVYRHEHDRVIVRGGLNDGDRVVLSRLDLMVEGMAVTAADKSDESPDKSAAPAVARNPVGGNS